MDNIIKKAVILVTEEDSDLFPLTRSIHKEFLPIGDTPLIQRVVDELNNLKVEDVTFLSSTEKKDVLSYFKNLSKLKEEHDFFQKKYESISFSGVTQKKEYKSGFALSKLKDKIEDDSFALLFSNLIFSGKKSSIEQLFAVHRTTQKQVVAIREVKDEEVPFSNIVKVEKIANRFYKIKKIIKNPTLEETDSRFALVDRYILTPVIFDYLKNSNTKSTLVETLNDMIGAGKTVYGHECEGSWFFIDNKENYLSTQKTYLKE
jgi:UTP--glucose-1-phosphate uridylyltransferase